VSAVSRHGDRNRTAGQGLTALLLVSLTGCGENAQARPLPRRAWVERANAICARADRQIHALGGATTLDQLARVLEETARVSDRELAELRALRPEPVQARPVSEILDNLERANAALHDMRPAAKSGSWSRVDAQARRMQALSKKADRLVDSYGLHECRRTTGEGLSEDDVRDRVGALVRDPEVTSKMSVSLQRQEEPDNAPA
jgi:hypothetical protein